MVGPGFTILLFCWLFSWSAGPSASEAQVVNPDLQGVLEELETSGVPPTAAELLEWGAQQNLPNTRDGMKASPWRGEILWRKGLYFPGGDEDLGRMELQRGRSHLFLRWRRLRLGEPALAGCVILRSGALVVGAGRIGARYGGGLLAARPGRSGSLAADGRLFPGSAGLGPWIGAPDRHTLEGVGFRWDHARFRLQGVVGRTALPVGGHPLRAVSMGLMVEVPKFRGGMSFVGVGHEQGVAVEGQWKGGALQSRVEATLWRPDPRNQWFPSGVALLGWSVRRTLILEGLLGFARMGRGPILGRKPAFLGGWDGDGMALRGVYKADRGLRVHILVAKDRSRDRRWGTRRNQRRLVDIQISQNLGVGLQSLLRYRSSQAVAEGWSSRYPWMPPYPITTATRKNFSLALVRTRNRFRYTLRLRSVDQGGREATRHRNLVSAGGWYAVSQTLRVRGELATAWGGDADLVAAVVPLTGLVLPRHWGSWRSETTVGVSWTRGGWRLQGAYSRRTPEQGVAIGAPYRIWCELRWLW